MTRLLAHAVNLAVWPLTRLVAAWDAADKAAASRHANGLPGDDA